MDFLIGVVNKPWFFWAMGGVILGYLLTLSVILAWWSGRDIRQRSYNLFTRIGVPFFVLAFGLVGFLAYVALRPKQTLREREEEKRERALLARAVSRATCPTCRAEVDTDFASCPFCKVDFAPVCESCGSVLKVSWKRCGFCGSPVGTEIRARKFSSPLPLDLEVLEKRINAGPLKKRVPAIEGKAEKLRKPDLEPKVSNMRLTLRRMFAIKR